MIDPRKDGCCFAKANGDLNKNTKMLYTTMVYFYFCTSFKGLELRFEKKEIAENNPKETPLVSLSAQPFSTSLLH
jgi:hypothetical protein